MHFELSEGQARMVSTLRRFVETELMPLEEGVESTGGLDAAKARTIFEKSRSLGFYAMNIPEEHGGGGLSALDTMLAEEQFGHTTDILVRRAFGNVYESLLECSEEQRQRWLLPTVRGERTCSIAMTEPAAGSDAAAIKTRAERFGTGWILKGSKRFISDGLFSDFFIVSAVTDPAARPRHVSLLLVDKAMSGVTVGRNQEMMGLTGTSHVELHFDGVKVGREHLLGEEGEGLALIHSTLGRARLAQVGARAIGKACRLMTLMTQYAKERRQFGKSIGEFQMIQQMIADSAIEINGARLLLHRAAWEIDQRGEARDWISMVKVSAAETLGRVADRAVQVFGGMGYCRALPVERLYRDARIYRIFDGTSEIHRTVLAKRAIGQGAEMWDIGA
jgi:acyl-CoA dehydrogenase